VLGVFGALFLSLFAFDVFEMGGSFWQTVAAFLIHLIPAALVLVAAALGWRWPWVGGLLFFALGALYVWGFRNPHPWSWDVIIAGPAFLTGLLFLAGWLVRVQARPAQ
jgi:hypothetical protein